MQNNEGMKPVSASSENLPEVGDASLTDVRDLSFQVGYDAGVRAVYNALLVDPKLADMYPAIRLIEAQFDDQIPFRKALGDDEGDLA